MQTTVVYGSQDLRGITPPTLKFGDRRARKAFREAYLKYVQRHDNAMRRRPPGHRVLSRAVVECIDPDLLMYICRYELPRRYRTRRPDRVDAMAVHNWVMKRQDYDLDAEDEEGITKIKELTCDISGGGGVRAVQQLFIEVRKIRRLYRLKTAEKQIISWLSYKLKPESVKRTILGILKQSTRKGKRSSRKIKHFHKLLRQVAETFSQSHQLGLRAAEKPKDKKSRRQPRRGKKGNRNNSNTNDGNDPSEGDDKGNGHGK